MTSGSPDLRHVGNGCCLCSHGGSCLSPVIGLVHLQRSLKQVASMCCCLVAGGCADSQRDLHKLENGLRGPSLVQQRDM